MLRVIGSYVYSLDTGDQSVYHLLGRFVRPACGHAKRRCSPPAASISRPSAAGPSGNYVYITDAGTGVSPYTNYIRIYTIGSNGALGYVGHWPADQRCL